MAKIIINEFLTFVQNKIDVLDETSIIKICSDNYSDAEIENGKTVLFTSCGDIRNIQRKGDDKKKKNIKDVIKLLKEIVDPNVQPTFVAKDLNRLPPITFDYVDVTRLLKDMTVMRSELTEFQTRISCELTDLRSSFDTHSCEKNKTSEMTTPKRSVAHGSLPLVPEPAPEHVTPEREAAHTPVYRDIVVGAHVPRQARTDRARRAHTVKDRLNATENIQPFDTSYTRPAAPSVLPTTSHDEGGSFTLVQKKRRTKTANMRGTLETNCKIQVAETQCSIYVSRTKKCVTEEDILEHIHERGEKCISVELLKQNYETSFNSFKVVVSSSRISHFLDTGFWPTGLVYRRYRERQVRIAPFKKPQ